jgi:hypothetical protein
MELHEIVLNMIRKANNNDDGSGFECDSGIVYVENATVIVTSGGLLKLYCGIDPVKLGEAITSIESDMNEWRYFG